MQEIVGEIHTRGKFVGRSVTEIGAGQCLISWNPSQNPVALLPQIFVAARRHPKGHNSMNMWRTTGRSSPTCEANKRQQGESYNIRCEGRWQQRGEGKGYGKRR